MINGVLTYKHYDEIIDHCIGVRTEAEAYQFLIDIMNSRPASTHWEISVADRIITRFPHSVDYYFLSKEFENVEDYEKNKYEQIGSKIRRIPDLEAKLTTQKQVRIYWLYELLLGLFFGERIEIHTTITEGVFQNNKEIVTGLSQNQLNDLFYTLKREGFCSFSSFEDISWIFFNEHGNCKIEWIGDKDNRPNYQRLIQLLYLTVENLRGLKHSEQFEWIQKRFVGLNGHTFKEDNLLKAIQRHNLNYKSSKSATLNKRNIRSTYTFNKILKEFI